MDRNVSQHCIIINHISITTTSLSKLKYETSICTDIEGTDHRQMKDMFDNTA